MRPGLKIAILFGVFSGIVIQHAISSSLSVSRSIPKSVFPMLNAEKVEEEKKPSNKAPDGGPVGYINLIGTLQDVREASLSNNEFQVFFRDVTRFVSAFAIKEKSPESKLGAGEVANNLSNSMRRKPFPAQESQVLLLNSKPLPASRANCRRCERGECDASFADMEHIPVRQDQIDDRDF